MIVRDPDTGEAVRLGFDFSMEYSEDLKPFRDVCDHPEPLTRCVRGTAEVDQCRICGSQKGGAFPRSAKFLDLPKFEEGLSQRWEAHLQEARIQVLRKVIAKARAAESVKPSGPSKADFEYAAYLRSPQWQKRRALVLRRAQGICEGCLSVDATEVHHRTYDHIGNELLFELVALCRNCHLVAHPEHRELDGLYEDYSVCASCRFDGGGAHCLKFNRPTFEAFSVGGECYPPGSALECLR